MPNTPRRRQTQRHARKRSRKGGTSSASASKRRAADDPALLAEVRFWEQECRRALGSSERFDDLAVGVRALPSSVDRAEVWTAVTIGVDSLRGHELFDPGYTRDRDDAYAAVDAALTRLGRVLDCRHLGDETAGLKHELQKLVAGEGERTETGAVTFHENTRRRLLRRTRVSMGWGKPGSGRPRAAWRDETLALLRKAGVSVEAAEELLEAAGLAGRSPTRRG